MLGLAEKVELGAIFIQTHNLRFFQSSFQQPLLSICVDGLKIRLVNPEFVEHPPGLIVIKNLIIIVVANIKLN